MSKKKGHKKRSKKAKYKKKYKKKVIKEKVKNLTKRKRRLLLGGIILGLIIIAALILFIFVKPEFLEGIFQKNSDANINVGASAQAKASNPGTSTSNSVKVSTINTNTGASVPLYEPDFPDYSAYYANLPNLLSQTPMVQDLPKGETVLLRFYNFNTGLREFEKSYLLTTGSVKEGYLDNPEITIVVHSKYVPELGIDNLCSTISKADSNNDVGIYTDLSTTKLIMKFKSMMGYKDCLM